MTIEECYKQLGGDYSNVLSRLSNDAIIRKFLVKFLSDAAAEIYSQILKVAIWKRHSVRRTP